ncbi:MAG TPA: sensor histidine kinase [Dyella sp.]|uniref:sensor histidine kinase n=1 Tax=Dyella sp. TaxID=1869338 RepID=UPI002F91F4C1
MRFRPAALVPYAVLAASTLLLVAVGAWYARAGGDDPATAGAHLTRAEWQVVDTQGFRAPPSTVDSASLPGTWQPVVLPDALHDAKSGPADGGVRTSWVKLSTQGLAIPPGPLLLYGARIHTDGTIAIYVNGQLVHRAQAQGPLWNSLFTPLLVDLTEHEGGAVPKEILLRIEHTSSFRVGVSSLWLGSPDAMRERYYVRLWLQQEMPATLNTAFLAVGFFALFIWFKRRHETSYLLFFYLAATSFAAHMHYYANLPIASGWFAWMTLNALFWLIVAIHFFLRQLHGRRLLWLTRGLVGISATITVLTLPSIQVLSVMPNAPIVAPSIYAIILLAALTVSIVDGVAAWNRSREGRLLMLCLGVCVLLGIPDWMLHNHVMNPEGWFTGAYTNAVTFGAFGLLMYRRYINAIGEVERINASLAQRLQQRESELALSHRRLLEAELRQTISDERQRLMQDMHDGLGSSLISAIRSVQGGGVDSGQVSQILKDCLDDLKLTIDSMEPVDADLLLLLAMLRFRLEPRLKTAGIALSWEVQDLPALSWLDPSSALHILRIAQESIANILRHAQASEIRVRTTVATDAIEVHIEDNGRGFDIERALAAATGRGLHNQQRRAAAIGGTVTWQAIDGGVRFTLRLPLERQVVPAG